jgi:hypothetical protein
VSSLYENDFYAWATEQATLLRKGDLSHADIENIAEEIESLGRSEKREMVSRLTVLLLHRLKWTLQPERRTPSWRLSIDNARDELADHMDENPSLRAMQTQALTTAYRYARRKTAIETGLAAEVFPQTCPWTWDEAMVED